ncbi:hemolysin family protein [Arsenicicoccus piscis]|uniref:Membrane protein n=1 Tax=Arsenicicoccus piscis TaxID=673954 RepID=A0ABQ6HSQ6_9MICO|nr:hemolysin family protein [Arsenicicoccus piscis]MCH8626618.1 hemolysin family protein [Arsenicicoccus piscis]GMA21275.1 membrane protein [Arsenicicoccus piscis]
MTSLALGLLVVILLTVATGYFVAQEFAYVAVDRGQLRRLADEGDAQAARAYEITERLSFTLSGAQLGITLTALLVGYAAEPLIGEGLAEALGGTGLPYAARLSLSVLVVLIFSTALQMVIGELAPKNLAIARPLPLARALARSTHLYLTVAGPIIRLFDSSSTRLLRAVGIEPVEELAHAATPDDLERIVDDSASEGALDPAISRLLDRGLRLRGLTVAQVMTPRVDVQTISASAPLTELLDLTEQGRARFPVVDTDNDDVLGVAGFTEILSVPGPERATTSVGDVARTAVVVPTTMPALSALEALRSAHQQIAVVIDEFGGLAGVITFEDLAEEVVGEIRDEDDVDEPTGGANPDGSWTVPAITRLDELDVATGLELAPGPGYDTLSGLVIATLGRLPREGEAIVVDLRPQHVDGSDEPHVGQVRIHVDELRRRVPAVVTITTVSKDGDQR